MRKECLFTLLWYRISWELSQALLVKESYKLESTVEVRVSYVENPGHFWCQLTRNTQRFKALMGSSIQTIANNAVLPYTRNYSACLAKRTADGKWSRALITGAQSSEHVNIIFVDYGDKEQIKTCEEYLFNY